MLNLTAELHISFVGEIFMEGQCHYVFTGLQQTAKSYLSSFVVYLVNFIYFMLILFADDSQCSQTVSQWSMFEPKLILLVVKSLYVINCWL